MSGNGKQRAPCCASCLHLKCKTKYQEPFEGRTCLRNFLTLCTHRLWGDETWGCRPLQHPFFCLRVYVYIHNYVERQDPHTGAAREYAAR
jgi:hypothetical protein